MQSEVKKLYGTIKPVFFTKAVADTSVIRQAHQPGMKIYNYRKFRA